MWLAQVMEEMAVTAANLARGLGEAELLRSRAAVLAHQSGCLVEQDGTVRLVGLHPGTSLPLQGQAAARMIEEARALTQQASIRAAADFDSLARMLDAGPPDTVAEDLGRDGGFRVRDGLGLAADLAGIVDPTPVSDATSGLVDLTKGDFVGVGLSALSVIPYLGDAAAKPVKVVRVVVKHFPALKRLDEAGDAARIYERVLNALQHVELHNLAKVEDGLSTLNSLHRKAEAAYKNEKWLTKAKQLHLPTGGPIVFVPPRNWNPKKPQTVITRGGEGFLDAFDNVWARGRGIGGAKKEWDVQTLSRSGLRLLTKDGKHLNVGFDGRVTH